MADQQEICIRFFADTHLGFDYPVRPRIARRRRGEDFYANFHRVLDGASGAKVDLLVHGGDLFFRSKLPRKIVDLTYDSLFQFAEKGIPLVIVPGNHERSRLPSSLYLTHPDLYVFARPETYTFEVRGTRICISGFPFERSNIESRFASILIKTGWEDAKADIHLLCFHQAVEGAQVGPSNYTFRKNKDVIRIADIPGAFDAVLAGHIHRRQILNGKVGAKGGTVPVIYSGSTERTSFAEKNEEKGFFELIFRRKDAIGWMMGPPDFIRLPSRPMLDLWLTDDVTTSNVEACIISKLKDYDRNAIVRIKYKGTPDDMLKEKLTAGFLRRVFPPSMNVQLGTEFRRFAKDS